MVINETFLYLGIVAIAFIAIASFLAPALIGWIIALLIAPEAKEVYEKITNPYKYWIGIVIFLTILDVVILKTPNPNWFTIIEILLGLTVTILISWLGSHLFREFFDIYLLDIVLQSGRKTNSELLMITKWLANLVTTLAAILIFAQVHQVNVLGLIASLGIGGLAVAFAAQKTLEQVLGGIVLYLDQPFVMDDYIGLPDGTFGRVESIGLRSTKIRTSGKGTLVVIPNSSLTQLNIENFSGIKKVISLIYLTFYQLLHDDEKALIKQVILESTRDIFGLDSRNTDVIFKDIKEEQNIITQAQVNFFVLGSGEVSMEFRQQLLDLANQKIAQQLKEYGIAFETEQKTINVESPITI
jgi:MscS family membrane protein